MTDADTLTDPLADPAAERRLAAIVAVDVAGYSARSETDEAAAVRAVQALAQRIEASAKAHGGRVFNTAGDGSMLEFPTASGALQTAEEIASAADPQVRVGVHLGEITVTAGGDLLGHGVNVAARLQALAQPGAVLVSDAVRRALVGPFADRLKPQGRIKLDKMSQTTAVFSLDLGKRTSIRRRRPWLLPAAAALATLAVIAAGAFAWLQLRPHELVVAVAPIEAEGSDPAVRALVQGLAGRIGASLAERQTPTVSEDAAASPGRGGARLLLRGVARRSGDRVVLDVRLEDRRNRQIVWSSSFERPAAQVEALDEQASVKITDVVSYAIRTLRDQYSDVDPETLATMLKLADINRSGRLRADERVAVDRRLIKLAPKLAIVHADLAFDLALTLYGLPASVASPITAEVRRESAEALRLNPKEANAYAALYTLTPDRAYGQREALLDKALASDPANENLNNAFADFRRATGRLRDSEPFYRKALTLDPLSPAKTATVIFALAGSGRAEESWDLAQRAFDRYVDNSSIARALLYTAILYQPPDAALAAIDRVQAAHRFTDDRVATLWRDYVNTARRGRSDPAVIRRMEAAALAGQIDPSTSASALASAGDTDGALRVWNTALDHGGVPLYAADLFEDAARNLRSDPRFWLLTKRLGLNAYWRASGVWPDFCAEPGLGYDCKAAAATAGF